MERILIFAATFNEADTIEQLIHDIFVQLPESNILVVDDASPDGTGIILDNMARYDPRIHIIHRPRKLGLGTAHKLAMKYAIFNNFELLITMDADYSHNPLYLPELVSYLSGNDFVIGSRYMKGGKSEYGLARNLLSRTANALSRRMLEIPLHECTTSYRGFRISLLKRINIDVIRSDGYSFFVEMLFYLCLYTKKVIEFPIIFEDRRAGSSKISKGEIIRGCFTLIRLFFQKLLFSNSLKKKINQNTFEKKSVCPNCGDALHTGIYPSTSQGAPVEAKYRCTSYNHKSHGRIVRCLQCGLLHTDIEGSSEEILKMYTSVEDPVYAQNIKARYETFRQNLSDIRLYLPTKGKLLDIGTYCGVFLKVAAEFGFEATGIEPSNWAVKYAREVLGLQVIHGTIHDLPQNYNNFDIITLWDVLEHLPNPSAELSAIHAKLGEDGLLALSTLNIDNWFPRVMGERWPWLMDMHINYFDPNTLKSIVSKEGFKLIHSQSYCHIITIGYLFSKLDSLGIWGSRYFKSLISLSPLQHLHVPFRFGDIQLYVFKKHAKEI